MLSEKILFELKRLGKDPIQIENQIANYETGFPYVKLTAAATIGNGIMNLDDNAISTLENLYDNEHENLSIFKFVPASGAASRMFKSLFEFLQKTIEGQPAFEVLKENQGPDSVNFFFENLNKFAFYNTLKMLLEQEGYNIESLQKAGRHSIILEKLLGVEGMNYGSLPKGLLLFHHDESGSKTAMEEHLSEGAMYAVGKNKLVKIHFTVSPEHKSTFEDIVKKKLPLYEEKYGVKYSIGFSVQKPETDMLAVDLANKPFYDNGTLLFRPGGHGALLDNLNDLDGDVIFIKNIDNVVPDRLKSETIRWKKALAGILLQIKNQVFAYLNYLETQTITNDKIDEIANFIENELNTIPQIGFENKSNHDKLIYFKSKLNRPIRVCGMVRNQGEPGGGPFWTVSADGTNSLQIVESSQVDMNDPQQENIFGKATHFNPVDLICSGKDFKGNLFNLLKFRDTETGFISVKSKDGKKLKAQELPGLWNGSMADWNTIFVETPLITFNPVKTVNDLLRDEHQ